jgi:hypothetical protein
MKVSHLCQTTGREWLRIGNAKGSQVFFRILINDIDSVFLVKITLTERHEFLTVWSEFEDGWRFVDTAVAVVVVDVSRFTGTHGGVARCHDTEFVVACEYSCSFWRTWERVSYISNDGSIQ